MNQTEFTLTTSEFAQLAGVKPESVRTRYYKFGSYFGYVPTIRKNGRLSWPTKPVLDKETQ
jgi:hypothetical protein